MKNDIPSFTHSDFRNQFCQKNFFAAASCWLLQEKRRDRSITGLFESTLVFEPNKIDVLLVHDVAQEQDRLDDDEDYKMNGG